MLHRFLSGVVVVAFAVSAHAQASDPAWSRGLAEFRGRYGDRWSAHVDPTNDHVEMIYGGRAELGGVPVTDEQWIERAQRAIVASRAVHGVDVATLEPVRVTLLPLGTVGSGDKWSVDLKQSVGGVRVEGGDVVALFDARGALLSIHNHALSDVTSIDVDPTFAAANAVEQATAAFRKDRGAQPATISTPELVVLPVDQDGRRVGRLAWTIDVQSDGSAGKPDGRRYWIDARFGYPLRDEASVHFFDVSGTVSTMATPGTKSDTASNPETAQPAKYIRVQYSGGIVYADVNGAFTIPGVVTPQSVNFTYASPFAVVDDQPTATLYSQVETLVPGSGNNVLLNAASNDSVTAQANIFNHIATVRDYVRRVTPTDTHADQLFIGHANIQDTCNANYNGVAINFFAAGGNCNNTAFSTVVAHEHGHWLNDLYGTNNGSDGMGEGNADVFALYVFDTPLNGEGFFTNGGAVRSGNNTRQFCGDCTPACNGEVHRDGEPWMGAAWKIRQNLNASLGNTAGDAVADQLFMGWMNAYNQRQIRSVIELQWLILDDDDANLANGTPHATDIKNGFRVQGFPGYDIEFGAVTTLADSSCEQGSYPVNAVVRTLQGTTLTAVTLRYRIAGGPQLSVPMRSTGGDNWTGSIPFVLSPTSVEYTIDAVDSAGNTKVGLCAPRKFSISAIDAFAFDGLDGVGGWMHASVGDTSNSNDDWQNNDPVGNSGTSQGVPWADPTTPFAGSACWGNDLGIALSGAGNGAYQPNVHNYLRSPAFNCSGQSGVQLIFRRWLTVEKSQYDTARILVNGVEVWRNPFATNVLDTGWTLQSVDISAQADNNPSVTIQFELQTDGGLELGGWQVDSLSLGRIVRAPQCSPVQSFCAADGTTATGCPCGNVGGPGRGCPDALNPSGGLLVGSGSPAANNVVLSGSGLPPGAVGVYIQQVNLNEHTFQNGVLCSGGTTIRLRVRNSPGGSSTFPDATDSITLAQAGLVAPGGGARRYYALWYRGGVPGFCTSAAANVTNGVMITW